MGLKKDLVEARKAGLLAAGATKVDTSPGSPIDVECTMQTAAISKLLTNANFTVTDLKAPVIVEDFNIPEQKVLVSIDTLMAEWKPVLDVLRKIATPLGISPLIDELEELLQSIFEPITETGYKTIQIDTNKNNGALKSTGYAFVGDDPNSQDSFDVDDRFGQRIFTKVKLLPEDIARLL